ncbi:unnamed protein product [Ectocarpus sp. 12 AP-2014]
MFGSPTMMRCFAVRFAPFTLCFNHKPCCVGTALYFCAFLKGGRGVERGN